MARTHLASIRLVILAALGLSASAPADGPIVPGVKSCVIEDSTGVHDFSYLCHWSEICCIAPVYAPCPFPPGGTCIVEINFACCDPLEDCWYQRQGNKIVVWCGAGIPP